MVPIHAPPTLFIITYIIELQMDPPTNFPSVSPRWVPVPLVRYKFARRERRWAPNKQTSFCEFPSIFGDCSCDSFMNMKTRDRYEGAKKALIYYNRSSQILKRWFLWGMMLRILRIMGCWWVLYKRWSSCNSGMSQESLKACSSKNDTVNSQNLASEFIDRLCC